MRKKRAKGKPQCTWWVSIRLLTWNYAKDSKQCWHLTTTLRFNPSSNLELCESDDVIFSGVTPLSFNPSSNLELCESNGEVAKWSAFFRVSIRLLTWNYAKVKSICRFDWFGCVSIRLLTWNYAKVHFKIWIDVRGTCFNPSSNLELCESHSEPSWTLKYIFSFNPSSNLELCESIKRLLQAYPKESFNPSSNLELCESARDGGGLGARNGVSIRLLTWNYAKEYYCCTWQVFGVRFNPSSNLELCESVILRLRIVGISSFNPSSNLELCESAIIGDSTRSLSKFQSVF